VSVASHPGEDRLPEGFSPRALARRSLPILISLTALVLIAFLAPGLGSVRAHLADASPGWLALGVALELASCFSYVAMFRPVFCDSMRWRTATQIGLSEVAVGSLVPASGAGGLALGAWILRREGMPAERIARRSVGFFLIKSSVNFVAVIVVGLAMAAGIGGVSVSPALTLLPAALAAALIAAVLTIPRMGPAPEAGPDEGRVRHAVVAARNALVTGTAEAIEVVRTRDLTLLGGAIGYWAFDNAVLWATYHALGPAPPLMIVLMGYLIGQLGGLLPLPGGVGGIDGGLLGTLVVYGAPAAVTAAAVLAYRLILFWTPLLAGTPAFIALWRELPPAERPEGVAAQTAG
jgi:uncharacterized membrane protein YbhN (UPF0104 family)